MRRREFITLVASAGAWPLGRQAQSQTMRRVGFLAGGWPGFKHYEAFSQGMSELGYIEGRDFSIEWRYVEGKFERLPTLAAELVALNVDVIVVNFTGAAKAVQQATSTIPIVMAYSTDPVGAGLVSSLARPGGNITGLATMLNDTTPKQIDLLGYVVPNLSRVAVLTNPGNLAHSTILRSVQEVARSRSLVVLSLEAQTPKQIEIAFAELARARGQAMIVITDPLFTLHRYRIAELAIGGQLPSIFPTREYVEAGGFLCYGDSLGDFHRRAAAYVESIFKGARPADLPVQQPRTFELIINLKTAKALGLTIPPTLLARADEVIE
jgi:ABC-type uncharacterized transport system substrate-binding protein